MAARIAAEVAPPGTDSKAKGQPAGAGDTSPASQGAPAADTSDDEGDPQTKAS